MAARHLDVYTRAEGVAAPFPPLLVAAERVAATVSQGVHGRRRVGQGETFWQFRRYESGDSAQAIDWRQSAKTQPVFVREMEWEAAQSVWLWRDASASMDYRSGRALPTKGERANLLLMALASLLVRGGEHVTLLGTGVRPGAGRSMLNRLALMLEDPSQPVTSLPRPVPLPRHGRIVMIGDFLSPLDEIKAVVDHFGGQGVRGHMLQVLDPAEETLPFEGRVRFEGMEEEGDALIGRVETVRQTYQDLITRHREGLQAMIRSIGWTFACHHTDRPPESALLGLFMALSEGIGLGAAGRR